MIQNRRDLGGIRTKDGRVIRRGRLIRSAHLAEATEEDLAGIDAVIDLRTPGEQRELPDRTWGRAHLSLPLFDDFAAGISHGQSEEERAAGLFPDMAVLYGQLVRECTEGFRRVLLAVMTHDFSAGAVLWHCTEGTDRCGITTDLPREARGVDRGPILSDSLKTNAVNLAKAARIRERAAAARGEAFADSVYRSYIADGRYLQAAWDALGEGNPAEWLGLPASAVDRFRETVLEENP